MVILPPTLARARSLGLKIFDNPKYDYDLNIITCGMVLGDLSTGEVPPTPGFTT